MKTMRFFSMLLLVCFSATSLFAQTADEIISKHIAALGGAENWRKINSVIQVGSMSVQGADIEMTMTGVHKVGTRQDISLMGMTGYQIVTPTEGWSFMPFQGQATPEAITADDLKDSQDGLDLHGPLLDYAEKGNTVEFLGKDDVDGTEAFKLKVTLKGGKVQTHYLDTKTYYIIKSVETRNANGQEMELATSYSNYTKLPEGIWMPMSVSVPLGPGFVAEMTISKIEINKPVDPSVFKPAK